jgi:hypothetical protein
LIDLDATRTVMAGEPAGGQHVFRSKSASWKIALSLVVAVFCIGAAVIGMVVALWLHVDQVALQFMTTLPFVFGFLSLLSTWRIAQAPTAVRVTREGFDIRYRRRTGSYPWQDIGFAMTELGPFRQRSMKIYHVDGRQIATLTDSMERFDELVARIDARVAARTDDASTRIRMAKARRMSVVIGVFGVFLLVSVIAVAWMTIEEARGARLLRAQGVPGKATIVDRRLAPDGVTPRLIYRIDTPEGRTGERNAEVTRPVWDDLANAHSVPVLYVPAEPAFSRLLTGEVEDPLEKNSATGYLVAAGGSVLVLLVFGMSALLWKGWSIDLDSKTGRLSFKPYGTGG